MGRPAIPTEVLNRIMTIWMDDLEQNAAEVHRKYLLQPGSHVIGVRKVQQIISDAKKATGSRRRLPLVEWRPWVKVPPNSVTIDYLLQLDGISQRASGRHLYEHEAKWSRRLQAALEGLGLYEQLEIIRHYASRERRAATLNRPEPYYADLDGLLAYKPWLPENANAYECALVAGLVPMPLFLPSEERLDLLRELLEHPDEMLASRYNSMPTFWERLRHAWQPGNFKDSYPHALSPFTPVKSRALDVVAEFWDRGSVDLPEGLERMEIVEFYPASEWDNIKSEGGSSE